jgi:phosphatidylcholine synthase
LLVPLLASAYGFSQTSAKTADGYFLGFPSYWNVVAFYLYVLQPPVWLSLVILLGLSLLTFVPLRYLYPTMPGRLNQVSNLLSFAWGALLVWVLCRLLEGAAERETHALTLVSLVYPAYYLAASGWVNLVYWRNRKSPGGRKQDQGASAP